MNSSKYFRFKSFASFMIGFILLTQVSSAQDAQELPSCQTTTTYIYVQPDPIILNEPVESEAPSSIPLEPYVIKIASEVDSEPIGLVIADNATVTLYSTSQRIVQVFAVRPEAKASVFHYLNPTTPVTTASTTVEQNVFNNGFNTVAAAETAMACDSSGFQASRPIHVLGGRSLARLEEEQREQTPEGSPEVSRRSTLSNLTDGNQFFSHELLVISPDEVAQAPDIHTVMNFHFLTDTNLADGEYDLVIQLVKLGPAALKMSIPSLDVTTKYYMTSDRKIGIEVMFLADQDREVLRSSGGTLPREDYFLAEVGTEPEAIKAAREKFFTRLRGDISVTFPAEILTSDYDPKDFLRLTSSDLDPVAVALRSFSTCEEVVPLENSTPTLYLAYKFFNDLISPEPLQKSGIDEDGLLRVVTQSSGAEQPVVDHWLMECVP